MTLEERIKKNEGLRLKVYKDTLGIPTIYYGHRVRQGEVYLNTIEDAEKYLLQDIIIAEQGARNLFPDIFNFTDAQRDALTELIYNMGANKIKQAFPRFVHNVNIGDWDGAHDELKYADGKSILSRWYTQVKKRRAEELLEMLVG